ncbi:GDP-L-fucose synthase [Parelusimicrobium proximum]
MKAALDAGGHNVMPVRSAVFDLTDCSALNSFCEDINPDIFILAGFYGISDPANVAEDVYGINKKILDNFIDAAGGRPVFTFGSGAEFDKSRPIKKAKETDLGSSVPRDLYGLAKYKLSQDIKQYANVYNLRLFGTYGPNEGKQRFITHAINCYLDGAPITIRQDVVFDYLFIDDLCNILLKFVENPPPHRFINITPTESISLTEIADIVNNLAEHKSEVTVGNPGLANEYTGDNSVLLSCLPEFKFTSYKDGITKLYEYLKSLR